MAKKKAVQTNQKPARVGDYGRLLRPIITEKSAIVGSATNSVVFEVDPRATKTEIREAIERVFSVKVSRVRTATFIGKIKRTVRSVGRRAGYKKAYVTLAEGQKIDIVEGL